MIDSIENDCGFSIIEILVAFTILSLSLVVTQQGITLATTSVLKSKQMLLIQAKVEELISENIHIAGPKQFSSYGQDGLSWDYAIERANRNRENSNRYITWVHLIKITAKHSSKTSTYKFMTFSAGYKR